MATSPLLDIQNLSVAFRQAGVDREVVSELSLQVNSGETLALVGESGSGKSVTALSILRLLPSPPVVYLAAIFCLRVNHCFMPMSRHCVVFAAIRSP